MTFGQTIQRIFSEPRPIRFILSRVIYRCNINIPAPLTFYGPLNVKTYFHASSAAHKLFIGRYKPELDIKVFEHYIKSDATVFDVGANIGMYTVTAARLAKSGRVYAFEATARSFAYILDNLRLNKVTNCFPVFGAVTCDRGQVSFLEHKYSHEQNHINYNKSEGAKILAIRLDNFMNMSDVGRVDFLKIDVEGAELQVLKSLGEKIRDIEVIYFESTKDNSLRFDYTPDELIGFLEKEGFNVKCPTLKANGNLEVVPYNATMSHGLNLIAERII